MKNPAVMHALAVVALVILSGRPADAQAADARWEPFLGCWDLVAEEAPRPLAAPDRRAERAPQSPQRAEVCVERSGAGVTLTTTVGGQPALSQQIVADGTDRPLTEGMCRGTERAEWSQDGRRLFSRGRLSCENEPLRSVSALSLFTPDGRWIDVQAVTVGGREVVRVRQYRARTPGDGVARTPGAPLSIEQVIEASRHVMPGVLEAALVETRARFPLTGKALIALDDANVPDSVTDLMVALSYPEAFVIERQSRDDRLTRFDPIGVAGTWDDWNPFWAYAALSPYDPYFGSAYYYSPFGFRYLGAYPAVLGSPAFLGSGAVIAVGDGGSSPDRPQDEPGRVINRQGYTRVLTTRAAETAESGSSGGRTTSSTRGTASPRGYTSGGNASGGGGAGAAGGTSGGGASGGGGGSGGTGRTAVPR